MIKKILGIGLSSVLLLGLTSTAGAIDSKTYRTAFCSVNPDSFTIGAAGSLQPPSFTRDLFEGITATNSPNPTTGTPLTVDCPIIRDDVTNTNGLSSISINVSDNSPTKEVTCLVMSCDQPGQNCSISIMPGSGIAFTGRLNLVGSLSVSWDVGTINIVCSLPESSMTVQSVQYAEFATGGDH